MVVGITLYIVGVSIDYRVSAGTILEIAPAYASLSESVPIKSVFVDF
jgi:hypothetical protein